MSAMNPYRTLRQFASDEFIINKSRFIGYAAPCETEAEALAFLQSIRTKHKDATHNCYAYIIGQNAGIMRYSDDGEPGGTAGLPMMEVLKHQGVVNCCCVVTRYFGGVLLGTGGLVRAYTQSTQAGIDAAQLVVVSRCVDLRIRIAYPRYEQLMRLAEDHGAKVLSTDFADAVTMNLRMLDGTQQPLLDALTALERGQEDVEVSDPIDAAF